MRNERQLSILSEEELSEIASSMELETVDPGWIGANLVFEGIPSLSYLPARTLIMFDNALPCALTDITHLSLRRRLHR